MQLEPSSPVQGNLQLILKIPKLSCLPGAKALQMLQEFPFQEFKRGEVFAGTASHRRVQILISGRVALVAFGRRNGGNIISIIPAGVLPILPRFSAPVSTRYQYRALTTCRLIEIPRKRFFEFSFGVFLGEHFDDVFDAVVGNFGDLLVRYRSFLGLDLLTRVGIALLDLAERFGIRDMRGAILPHFFSHDDLADLVGASRSRVTSAVNRLERDQIVGREGRQIVVDTSGLRVFIESHA